VENGKDVLRLSLRPQPRSGECEEQIEDEEENEEEE
jgi:hypothetical protein